MQNIKAALSQHLITAGTEEIYFAKEEMSNVKMHYITKYDPLILFPQGCPIMEHFLEKLLLNLVPVNLYNLNFVLDIIGTA